MFEQVLDLYEQRLYVSPSALLLFLTALFEEPAPFPGMAMSFSCRDAATKKLDYFTIKRPGSGTVPSHVSFSSVFHQVPCNDLIRLLTFALTEARIVLVAKSLHKLSDTVNALTALLQPFSWQHVYIPVLPKAMIGYLMAPMPFLIGCLSSSWEYALSQDLVFEEIAVYDVSNRGFILSPSGPRLPVKAEALLRNMLSTRKPDGKKDPTKAKAPSPFD
jgi:hypothetical protein